MGCDFESKEDKLLSPFGVARIRTRTPRVVILQQIECSHTNLREHAVKCGFIVLQKNKRKRNSKNMLY